MKHPERALLLVVFALLDCAKLGDVVRNECGNGAVEAAEDCDGFAAAGLSCGAPGSAAACRYACSSADGCPRGWGCGRDGICRAASGTFLTTHASFPRARRLALADFDGDGVRDVLGTANVDDALGGGSEPRIALLDRSGSIRSTITVAHAVSSPRPHDVDGDGIADLVVASVPANVASQLSGVATLLGDRGGAFLSLPYDALSLSDARVRVLTIGGVTETANGEVSLAILGEASGTTVHSLRGGVVGASLGGLPTGADALFAVSDLLERTPCEEVVVLDAGRLERVDVCDDGGAVGALRRTTLATGLDGATALFSLDVDRDGHRDVVLASDRAVEVALGDGKGSLRTPFVPLNIDLTTGAPADSGAPPAGASGARVLAIASDTHALVIATENAIFAGSDVVVGASSVAFHGAVAATKLTGSWSAAVIGDVDGDGLADVVVGASGARDLDVLLGTGRAASFARRTLSTEAGVTALTLSDLDGDGIGDICLSETGGTVRVAFGRAYDAPSAPTALARFDHVVQVAGASFDGSSPERALVVVTDRGVDDAMAVFVGGGSGRAPLSLVSLAGPSTSGIPMTSRPLHLEDAKRLDAAVVAFDGASNPDGTFALRVWAITSLAARSHRVVASAIIEGLNPFFTSGPTPTAIPIVSMTAADVDGDGLDEAWIVSLDARGDTVLLRATMSTAGVVVDRTTVLTGISLGSGGDLVPLDVDSDGHRDLVLFTGEAGGVVEVLWNDGTGGFTGASSTRIVGRSPTRAIATAAAFTRGQELIVLGASSLDVVRADGRNLSVAALADRGGLAVAAGDIDGDGVDDIVVAVEDGLDVAMGKAVR